MHRIGAPLILFCIAVLAGGDPTLITTAGEKIRGRITRSGTDYVVQTATGTRKIPEAEVGCVYDDVREVTQRADDRFRDAKKLFEEASKLDETHPLRNTKFGLAIEMAQSSAGLYRLLEPHARGEEQNAMARQLQVMMQFIRLCRGAATSDLAGGPAPAKLSITPLAELQFKFERPPEAERPWVLEDDLGPGLGAAARDLGDPTPETRLDAVRRLAHPPSPLHFPALLKLLETEQDPEIVGAIVPALRFMEPAPLLKALAWVRRETDPAKRAAVFSIVRSVGERAAFDFVLEWFSESPPAQDAERAAFASVFRQHHALSVQALKELLTKTRNPKMQSEAIKQLGVIGDKAAGPMILKAMPAYTRDAVVSLIKLGKPALPTLVEGARSQDHEVRRICNFLCRKTTGVQGVNLIHFENWWTANRKTVADEEKAWWDEQARKGWKVDPAAFAPYELPLESFVY